MRVNKLIKELLKFNQKADIKVVSNNRTHEFTFSWGSKEDSTKNNCDIVCINIDNNN